jgi:hypothetical protein
MNSKMLAELEVHCRAVEETSLAESEAYADCASRRQRSTTKPGFG